MGLSDFFRSFLGPADASTHEPQALVGAGQRTTGPPMSSNGASSMHLFWQLPETRLQAVEATIEVLSPPPADRLVFWALQVGFAGASRLGAGHLGLQHHPQYPGRTAVNWGGYHSGGGELTGSALGGPSALGNPNTCDFSWEVGRSYRYAVTPTPDSAPGSWRGTVTDVATGDRFIVRDLYGGGDHLVSPMVWTESFAHCDDPSASARWSNLRAISVDGDLITPASVRVNYQSTADGGCDNTNCWADATGIVQATATERTSATGDLLSLP